MPPKIKNVTWTEELIQLLADSVHDYLMNNMEKDWVKIQAIFQEKVLKKDTISAAVKVTVKHAAPNVLSRRWSAMKKSHPHLTVEQTPVEIPIEPMDVSPVRQPITPLRSVPNVQSVEKPEATQRSLPIKTADKIPAVQSGSQLVVIKGWNENTSRVLRAIINEVVAENIATNKRYEEIHKRFVAKFPSFPGTRQQLSSKIEECRKESLTKSPVPKPVTPLRSSPIGQSVENPKSTQGSLISATASKVLTVSPGSQSVVYKDWSETTRKYLLAINDSIVAENISADQIDAEILMRFRDKFPRYPGSAQNLREIITELRESSGSQSPVRPLSQPSSMPDLTPGIASQSRSLTKTVLTATGWTDETDTNLMVIYQELVGKKEYEIEETLYEEIRRRFVSLYPLFKGKAITLRNRVVQLFEPMNQGSPVIEPIAPSAEATLLKNEVVGGYLVWPEKSVKNLMAIYNRIKANYVTDKSKLFEAICKAYNADHQNEQRTVISIRHKIERELENTQPKSVDKQMKWNTDNNTLLSDSVSEIYQEMIDEFRITKPSKESIYRRIYERFLEKTESKPTYGSVRAQILKLNFFAEYPFEFLPVIEIKDFPEEIFSPENEPFVATEKECENMPKSLARIRKYFKWGQKHRQTPPFNALCFTCGAMLYGKVGQGHKWVFKPQGDQSVEEIITKLYRKEVLDRVKKYMPWKRSEREYFWCRNCKNNPYVNLPSVFNVVSRYGTPFEYIEVPEPIATLENEWEQSEIALACLNMNPLIRRTYQRNRYTHMAGAAECFPRSDREYHRIGCIGISTKDFEELRTSNSKQKVIKAIQWLRKKNHLFQKFLANFETLYRWTEKGNDPLVIFSGLDFSKGKVDVLKELGHEGISFSGVLYPPEDEIADDEAMTTEDGDMITAVSHPNPSKEDAVKARAALIQGCYVKHNDFYKHEKLFVHLYPFGFGGYSRYRADQFKLKFTLMDFAKYRLLNLDPRWRLDDRYLFFLLNDQVLDKLYKYNVNTVRSVDPESALRKTAGEILEQKNKTTFEKMGTRLPTNMSGSGAFWHKKFANLMAMTEHYGPPNIMVTLTQSDADARMQSVFNELDDIFQPTLQHDIDSQKAYEYGWGMQFRPAETVIIMNQYLREFMDKFIRRKTGPFGNVVAHFIRAEYQQRGAVHYHVLLWLEKGTYDEERIVTAEMPRGPKDKDGNYSPEVIALRKLVTMYQKHTCRERCRTKSRVKRTKKGKCKKLPNEGPIDCRFGFPAKISHGELIDTERKRYTYVRRQEEDINVSPYNMELLIHGYRHVNVIKLGPDFPIDYICKYITKPEKRLNIKLPKTTGQVAKYLNRRIVGGPEAAAIELEVPQCIQSVEVVYIPSYLQPRTRVIKRAKHLPADESSSDIYYKTKFEYYLNRPTDALFEKLTYPQFYQQFKYKFVKETRVEPCTCPYDDYDGDDEWDEENPNVEETSADVAKASNILPANQYRDQCHRVIMKRRNPVIVRTEFILPCGEQQNQWMVQQLMWNVPWNLSDLSYLMKIKNDTNALLVECEKYGLLDELGTGIETLESAQKRGLNCKALLVCAKKLLNQGKLTQQEYDEYCLNTRIGFAKFGHDTDEESGEDDETDRPLDERFTHQVIPVRPLRQYIDEFKPSQRKAYEYITSGIEDMTKPCRVCVCGEAGVGKTHLIQALIAYMQEEQQDMKFVVLASTGAAAANINGRTIYNFLKMDTKMECRITTGTHEAKELQDTDVIIIDEMSMITRELFDNFQFFTRKFCQAKYNRGRHLFGGRHIIMFGDFQQLPAIGKQLYCSQYFGPVFKFLVLTEIVRQEEKEFQQVLSDIRKLDYNDKVVKFIKQRSEKYAHLKTIASQVKFIINRKEKSTNPKHYENVMILVPRRADREEYNRLFLNQIQGDIYCCSETKLLKKSATLKEIFEGIRSEDTVQNMKGIMSKDESNFFERCVRGAPPKILQLKIGAKVVLLRNLDTTNGWVNGTLARVERIGDAYITISKLRNPDEKKTVGKMKQSVNRAGKVYTRCQFPVELAYSMTMHKAQGLTVADDVYVNLKGTFKPAQPYVAFSRCKSSRNLHIFEAEKIVQKKWKLPYLQKLMIKWIDEVNEISPNKKNIPFPDNIFFEDFVPPKSKKESDNKEPEKEKSDDENDIDMEKLDDLLNKLDQIEAGRAEKKFSAKIPKEDPLPTEKVENIPINLSSSSDTDATEIYWDNENESSSDSDIIVDSNDEISDNEDKPGSRRDSRKRGKESGTSAESTPVRPSLKAQKTFADFSKLTITPQREKRIASTPMIVEHSIETLSDMCRYYLLQLERVYKEDNAVSVRTWMSENRKFCDQVFTCLRSRHPLTSNRIPHNIPRAIFNERSKTYPHPKDFIPNEMRPRFEIIRATLDGNCWYNAVSISLFGTEEFHPIVRMSTILVMALYPIYYQSFSRTFGFGGSLKKLFLEAGKDKEWGFPPTQNATSIAIDRPLIVYKAEGFNVWVRPTQNVDFCSKIPICIALKVDHFNLLCPKTESDQGHHTKITYRQDTCAFLPHDQGPQSLGMWFPFDEPYVVHPEQY